MFNKTLIGCDSDWNICESPHPSGDTSSVQAVDTIQNWIDVCKRDHSCGTARDHSYLFPKRLLELSTEHIHLREDVGPSIAYACLSHCWGRVGPALRLDRNSRHALRAGWSIDRLPKTFHDAVILCLNLGIQYLWIDALCMVKLSLTEQFLTNQRLRYNARQRKRLERSCCLHGRYIRKCDSHSCCYLVSQQ